MDRKKKIEQIFHVEKGQIYRVPRPNKPYRTVRIVRVRNLKARAPEAILQETTRGGRPKGEPFRTVLTCNGDRTWRLAPGYEQENFK